MLVENYVKEQPSNKYKSYFDSDKIYDPNFAVQSSEVTNPKRQPMCANSAKALYNAYSQKKKDLRWLYVLGTTRLGK